MAQKWAEKHYLVFHPNGVGPGTTWVQLEVVAMKYRDLYNYAIYNPRAGVPIETSIAMYDTPKKAVEAGLAYLRATYNTGQPQKKR